MPKAKPKTPKTEKMWMGWDGEDGFMPSDWGFRKNQIDRFPVPVRIVPEAEYQRMRKAAKDTK